MVYRAKKTKSYNDKYKFYFGLTDTAFKGRCKNHSRAFKYQKYQNISELVKYNWHLNQNNILFFPEIKIYCKGLWELQFTFAEVSFNIKIVNY